MLQRLNGDPRLNVWPVLVKPRMAQAMPMPMPTQSSALTDQSHPWVHLNSKGHHLEILCHCNTYALTQAPPTAKQYLSQVTEFKLIVIL